MRICLAKPQIYYWEFKRDKVPLQKNHSPFPLLRGRGIKGDRVYITSEGVR